MRRCRRRGRLLPVKPVPALNLKPLEAGTGLRRLACDAIRQAIMDMDIYGAAGGAAGDAAGGHAGELWLDERQLSADLGVSRTPVREALGFLEQDGLIRSVPRRGAYVVRKTKREIVEMVTVWAAMESMAARLAAQRASDAELRTLRDLVGAFKDDPSTHVSEYSQANMAFHRAIIGMGGCALMTELTDTMFIHMRAVRAVTMGQGNRAARSIRDHLGIVEALGRRDADLAERRVREHTLGLAAHIEAHGDALDTPQQLQPAADVLPSRTRRTPARPAAPPGPPAQQ